MQISIIIPNYNGQDLLRQNLPKVFDAVDYYSKEHGEDVEIIVIDDKSTDKSIDYLRSLNGKIKLIENEKNLGFSSTVNLAVKRADGEIIVLLNTDVSPEKDFLLPLVKHFKDEKVFAVGCMDKSIEGDKTILRGRGVGKWRRGFLVHARGEVDKTDTLWVSGGSGAIRKKIWEKLGGFNELYNPFYWEDIDLSYRALKSGYKILFEQKSVLVHEHGKGAIKNTFTDFQIKTIAYRNQFLFVWLNATDLELKLLHGLWFPYHFVRVLTTGDWAFFIGFFQALIHLPQVIVSSLQAQKYFVKSDKEVVKDFT